MPYGLSTGEVPHAGRGGAIIDIVEYGAWTASEKIEAGELTSEALVRACLERIAARAIARQGAARCMAFQSASRI